MSDHRRSETPSGPVNGADTDLRKAFEFAYRIGYRDARGRGYAPVDAWIDYCAEVEMRGTQP